MDELGGGTDAQLRFALAEDDDGSPLLKLEGELDLTNADALDASVTPVLARAPARFIVDASHLEFADSSAIALLVKWASLVPELELREPSQLLRRVIVRMGLGEQLEITP